MRESFFRKILINNFASYFALLIFSTSASGSVIHFVYTSDPHYGITRDAFQDDHDVDAATVSEKMIEKMNSLTGTALPNDGGVGAGQTLDGLDFIVNTGDIANREEKDDDIQSATASWKQFADDYIKGITLKDADGNGPPLFLVAGNHDVNNAIGYYKTLNPLTDPAVMVAMYNMMLNPVTARTGVTYTYAMDKVHYSKDIKGVHFVFVNIWPDSSERIWMEKDLHNVSSSTPVIIFAHDPPEVDAKHFTNPNGRHDINDTDEFENLLAEVFKDGNTTSDPSVREQRGFADFVAAHPNIKAYFHGHDNANEYYVYEGPDNTIALNTFRVDSPMKGNDSESDEIKLSFQVVSIDTDTKKMTVRECLWNTRPKKPSTPVSWGETATISIEASSIRVHEKPPVTFSLAQNYPNPFNPVTRLHFSIPCAKHVTLTIYDVLGQEVASLASRDYAAGSYTVDWDARGMASGLYFSRLQVGNSVITKQMLLLR